MTAQTAPAEVTPEAADRLKAEADELYRQAAQLEHEADLALARSDATWLMMSAAVDLAEARKELDEARTQLARVTAEFDPVQADLTRVKEELAATTIAGNLDERLAARMRRAALEAELEPLEALAAQLMNPVANLRNLVSSLEHDSIPHFEAELAAKRAAVQDPPLHDLGRLALVAPSAANSIAMRQGLLTLEPEQVRTAHGQQVLSAVLVQLRMSGLGATLRAQVEAQLLAELPGNLAAKVRGALSAKRTEDDLPRTPPEYKGITDESIREQARREGKLIQVDPVTGQPPGPRLDQFPSVQVGPESTTAQGAQLPLYDSAQGARLRRADREGRPAYRGPADWPR